MINRDEFVENESYCVITGKDEFGVQHIAKKSDSVPLCGVRIVHVSTCDLFTDANLCERCAALYSDTKGE